MKDLVFVKLGGSLITDKQKPYTLNSKTIDRLSKEIYQARKKKNFKLILGHGSGSFGHSSAHEYQTIKGFIDEQSKYGLCVVQNDAAKLNRIVVSSLLGAGEKCISIQSSCCSLAKDSRIIEYYLKPIKKLLEHNIVPVPYGDVGIDIKKGCCVLSTEEIFSYLAKKLKPERIIMTGDGEGVYADYPCPKLIPRIDKTNWQENRDHLGKSSGIDVTGGMLHKIDRSIELAKIGINTSIINGNTPHALENCLLGEESGTLITW